MIYELNYYLMRSLSARALSNPYSIHLRRTTDQSNNPPEVYCYIFFYLEVIVDVRSSLIFLNYGIEVGFQLCSNVAYKISPFQGLYIPALF